MEEGTVSKAQALWPRGPKFQPENPHKNAKQPHFVQVSHPARPCTFFLLALFLFHQIKPGLQIQFSSLIRPCLPELKHTYRTSPTCPTIHRPLPCHIQLLYSARSTHILQDWTRMYTLHTILSLHLSHFQSLGSTCPNLLCP